MDRFATSIAKFDGRILERGFWLYVWTVSSPVGDVLYVGRTGDSSSGFASSPFSRLGQHLDLKVGAKANSLLKNLRAAKIDPLLCTFEMFAIGPLFLEQRDLAEHRKRRDKLAALEFALAQHLGENGYRVLGTHGCRKPLDRGLFNKVIAIADGKFPDLQLTRNH